MAQIFLGDRHQLNGNFISSLCEKSHFFYSFDVSLDGKYLLGAASEATYLWDIQTGLLVKKDERQVWDVAFSYDSKYMIMTGTQDIVVFEVNTGRQISTIVPTGEMIDTATSIITPDDKYIIALGHQGMTMWNLLSGKEVLHLPKETKYGSDAIPQISPNGVYALVPSPNEVAPGIYGDDQSILWNIRTNIQLKTFPSANDLQFLPNSAAIAALKIVRDPLTGKDDLPQIDFWRLPNLTRYSNSVQGANVWRFSPDSTAIIYNRFQSTRIKTSILWNFLGPDGKHHTTELNSTPGTSIYGFLLDNRRILLAGDKLDLALWDGFSGIKLNEFSLPFTSSILKWKFLSNDRWAVLTDNGILIIDLNTGTLIDAFC